MAHDLNEYGYEYRGAEDEYGVVLVGNFNDHSPHVGLWQVKPGE